MWEKWVAIFNREELMPNHLIIWVMLLTDGTLQKVRELELKWIVSEHMIPRTSLSGNPILWTFGADLDRSLDKRLSGFPPILKPDSSSLLLIFTRLEKKSFTFSIVPKFHTYTYVFACCKFQFRCDVIKFWQFIRHSLIFSDLILNFYTLTIHKLSPVQQPDI